MMHQLSKDQMKNILGGVEMVTECAVYCQGKRTPKDCGEGVACVLEGETKIRCGSQPPEEMCDVKPPLE